jgi:hypothetical protein
MSAPPPPSRPRPAWVRPIGLPAPLHVLAWIVRVMLINKAAPTHMRPALSYGEIAGRGGGGWFSQPIFLVSSLCPQGTESQDNSAQAEAVLKSYCFCFRRQCQSGNKIMLNWVLKCLYQTGGKIFLTYDLFCPVFQFTTKPQTFKYLYEAMRF